MMGGLTGALFREFADDEKQIVREFKSLKFIFEELKSKFFASKPDFKEISMGMSDDYKLAIEQGSTIVRIGSSRKLPIRNTRIAEAV